MTDRAERIHTGIWREDADPADPFVAERCLCRGYDVYGEILPRAGWSEYLFLLLRGERPAAAQARLLERLAIGLANPGPRDPSVRAAMNAGVARTPAAAMLSAALAVGAGQFGGGHEVYRAMCGMLASEGRLDAWAAAPDGDTGEDGRADIWLSMEHPAGFDPHAARCGLPVQQLLACLVDTAGDAHGWLAWLQRNREEMERRVGAVLAVPGVAAAALLELGFDPAAGEMLYLLLRLPGAAAHALEQAGGTYRRYPFFHGQVHRAGQSGQQEE
ncbi:MAG TPA: citryl-CoA lyase [Gammaproteobacteria bacterium]|nr:citryl-CoA lyase [Gammaproteobacteria bacterium]